MPVEPIPCAQDGGGGGPVDLTACCAPSIASAALCRADGTTVLLVVRSGCAECGETGPDPEAVGWIDAATGVFTPGPAPADAGPCSSGCIDTVCVTRCDDTTGDGAADTTYTELWCVHADGTTGLVLTYSGDPSTPYVPVAPVECEYGCPQTETLTLCDDSGPFLRRITWLAGAATYEDIGLDGQTPHVVTGDVTVCSGSGGGGQPCAEQTTPTATLGLCLPDGTPLAVLVTRDCDGTVTQDGWLNLTTGAYTAGPPPVGAAACGDSRAFELAGLLCDVDPATGDVLGLVLVEYEYAADGSLASVRLVDPATGATYALQGELRHCPAGAGTGQPEQDAVVLCDTAADGAVTAFVRDYRRDENGAVVGHSDYTLDGDPYTPSGTVGTCTPETGDVETWPLCVVDASGVTVARVRRETVYDRAGNATTTRLVDALTGAPYTMPAGTRLGECCQTTREAVCVAPLVPTSKRVVSNPGNNTSGRVDPDWTWGLTPAGGRTVYDVAPSTSWTTPLPAGGGWVSLTPTTATSPLPPGAPATYYMVTGFDLPDDAVLDATTITIDTLNADNSVWGYALGGAAETATDSQKTWFNQPPYREAEHRIDGAARGRNLLAVRVVESNPPSPGGVLLDVTLTYRVPGSPQYWTVEYRDCGTTTFIDPDGNRYEGGLPEGYIACGSSGSGGGPAECRDTSTVLLCDLPTGGTPDLVVTDTDPTPYYPYPTALAVTGAQTLWDGGTLDLPPGTGPQPGTTGTVGSLAATVQAPRPACDSGTARVAVSLNVRQTGPDNGCGQTGHLRLFVGTTQTALTVLPAGTPSGWSGTLTVEADVPAAELAAGNVAVALALDAYDDNPTGCAPSPRRTGWQLSALTATVAYEQTGCATQLLRTVLTDCETGAVVSVTDTTLDGQPYEVTGEVGQCETTGGGECCPLPEPEPCRNTSTLLVCDLPGNGEPTPTVTDTSPAPYDAGTPGTDPVTGGAAALWSGGVLTIPPDTTPSGDGYVQRLRSFASTVQAPRPGCDTGTATVTASVRVERDGPDPGCLGTGMLALIAGGTPVSTAGVTPPSIPVGTVTVLTVSATVPAAELAAGTVALVGRLETYHLSPGSCPGTGPGGARVGGWTVDDFTVSVAYDQAGCAEQVFANVVTDCETGAVQSVTYTLPDGTPYTPQGTIGQCEASGACCPDRPCPAQSVIEQCRCDDTDGDGIADTDYVELLGVDCTGTVTSLGTYLPDLAAEYAPVAPVDCQEAGQGAELASGVQARRVELAAGASWIAAAWPTLQSVTAVAHGGTGTVTTADGASPLHPGEAVTWSVTRDHDAVLTGPLTIAAGSGTVTVSFTIGVTL